MWPERGSNYSSEKPKIKSQLSYSLGYGGPQLEFLPKGSTISGKYYINLLDKLRIPIHEKWHVTL